MGRIPATIHYVDSLTVFNSTVNPYKQYKIIDNSLKNTMKKKEVQKNNLSKIDDLKTIQEFKSN